MMGILGLVALVSCSVKEDRGDCPCWLTVEADNTVSVNGWFGTRSLFKVNGGFIDKKVPRGLVDVVANIGSFSAPEGQQMDSLFARRIPVDTDGESAFARVTLCKNFATIELDFKDEDDGRTVYDLLATGTVSGADARTLEPGRWKIAFELFPILAPYMVFICAGTLKQRQPCRDHRPWLPDCQDRF